MADHDYKDGTIRRKYHITKADGSECDPQAEYFVLRIDEDPHARKALAAYADSVEADNPAFASDLRYWLEYGLREFKQGALADMGFTETA